MRSFRIVPVNEGKTMSIESETFSNYSIKPDRLLDYGFQPENARLVFKKNLPEDNFEIVIEYDGTLRGRINDLAADGEYMNYRIEGAHGYSAGIRQKFIDLLLDIRENCCRNQYFKGEFPLWISTERRLNCWNRWSIVRSG